MAGPQVVTPFLLWLQEMEIRKLRNTLLFRKYFHSKAASVISTARYTFTDLFQAKVIACLEQHKCQLLLKYALKYKESSRHENIFAQYYSTT